jgi:alpha-ribazole phosphatase
VENWKKIGFKQSMDLFLVRHTEVENLSGRCIGQSDVPLSEKGKRDVGVLVERLKSLAPTRLISSDLSRCRLLAEALGDALAMTMEVKSAWREVNFGKWENQSWDDVRLTDSERFEAWTKDFVTIAPPEGESFLKLQLRINAEVNALKETHAETLVVITHAGAIRTAVSSLIGLSLERAFSIHLNYGALIHLRQDGERWTLQEINNSLLPCDRPTTYSR